MSRRVIEVVQHGKFKKLDSFLERASESIRMGQIDKYGKAGVEALRAATPKDTGLTASSWGYEIERRQNGDIAIIWTNDHIVDGNNIAILLQYGHSTRNGGYVEGIDYINPALRPIFEEIAKTAWEVIR